MFVAKENYEDVMESAKSFIQLKLPEFKSPNICAIGGENTLVIPYSPIVKYNNKGGRILSVLCKSI